MSDERVICTYLGGIKRVQIHDLNRLWPMLDAGQWPNIGDMIGYLNEQERLQYPTGPVQPEPTPEEYVILQEFMPGHPRFVFTSQRSPISAIPFYLPMTWSDPWGKAAAAEYGSGGTGLAEAAINPLPGDMTGYSGSGSNLTIDFQMGTGIYQPGALLYYNHRMAEGHGPRGTGFSVEFPKAVKIIAMLLGAILGPLLVVYAWMDMHNAAKDAERTHRKLRP